MNQKLVGSIKGWSIALGVLSLSSLLIFKLFPLMSTEGFLAVVALLLGLAVLYAGLKVQNMNKKSVNAIFWAKLVWVVIGLIYMSVKGYHSGSTIVIALAEVVMAWILIMKLRRLSPESATGATPQAPAATV
jgi:hypothetical protein